MNKYLHFVSVMLKAGVQYFLIYLISSSLGTIGLSKYYFIVACYSIFSILVTFGINNSFIRFSKLSRINKIIYFKWTIIFAPLIIFSILFYLIFESVIHLIVALSITKGFYLLFESINISIGKYSRVIRVNLYYFIVIIISFGLVEVFSFSLNTLLLLLCIAESTLMISFSVRFLSPSNKKSIKSFWRQIKTVIGYSIFIWIIGFLNTLLFTIDRLVVEHFLETETLAIYGTLALTFFSVHRFFSTPYLTLVARNYFIVKNAMYLFRYTAFGLFPLVFSLSLLLYTSPWIFRFLSLNPPDFSLLVFAAINVIVLYLYTALIIEFKREAKMSILFIFTLAMAVISISFNFLTIEPLQLYAPLLAFAFAYTTAFFVLLFILGFKKYGIRNTG